MVPVAECKIPIVTSVSVTANPVVFTLAVGKSAAKALVEIRPADNSAPTSTPLAFIKPRLLKIAISYSPL